MKSDPRISLRNSWLAGILAFALPGAGHFYQRRYFKSLIFFVSIMGLFLTGLFLSGGQAIQPPATARLAQTDKLTLLKFGTQAGVGSPVLFSLWQRSRYFHPSNATTASLSRPFSSVFTGNIAFTDDNGHYEGPASGRIFFEPSAGQFGRNAITGRFEGQVDGREVQLAFSDSVRLGRPIDADKKRDVAAEIVTKSGDSELVIGQLRGTIPRGFWNWFEVPMSKENLLNLHGQLGKFFELAMVFTWIAGLLNILAIWDAVEGPAYGYGRELVTPEVSTLVHTEPQSVAVVSPKGNSTSVGNTSTTATPNTKAQK